MTASPDIRWIQRFDNFTRAHRRLREALNGGINQLSELEQEGTVQRFEYCYELAWKTLKDYLEHSGVVLTPATPRNVIKEAFAIRLIDDGQAWIDMLNHRNLLAHDYDEENFKDALQAIHDHYLACFDALQVRLQREITP